MKKHLNKKLVEQEKVINNYIDFVQEYAKYLNKEKIWAQSKVLSKSCTKVQGYLEGIIHSLEVLEDHASCNCIKLYN